MAERKTFRVYFDQASSVDTNLFCIEGPGMEYVARNRELAQFIEKVLNAALAAFPEQPKPK